MKTTAYNNLPKIASARDLPEGAAYYSWEGFHTRSVHQDWIIIYDDEFNVLASGWVKYTSALSGLRRIARTDDKDPVLMAYVRTPLNDAFDLIESDGDTMTLLEAAARRVMKGGR